MVQWMGRTALELLGQGALGYSFDPIVEEPLDNTFADSVKSFLYVSSSPGVLISQLPSALVLL